MNGSPGEGRLTSLHQEFLNSSLPLTKTMRIMESLGTSPMSEFNTDIKPIIL